MRALIVSVVCLGFMVLASVKGDDTGVVVFAAASFVIAALANPLH